MPDGNLKDQKIEEQQKLEYNIKKFENKLRAFITVSLVRKQFELATIEQGIAEATALLVEIEGKKATL